MEYVLPKKGNGKMKKTSIIALVAATTIVLGGCSIFQPTKLTPPTLPPEATSQGQGQGQGLGGGSDPTITTANLKPVDYEYDFDAHNPNDWQKAYKKFLEEDVLGTVDEDFFNTEEYFLADIDDTFSADTPELCIRSGSCEADYQLLIYTYERSSGEVVCLVGPDKIYAGHTTYYQGPSGDLYAYSGHMGYLSVTKIVAVETGDPGMEEIFNQDTNPGEDWKEGDPIEDYKTMSEILGEKVNPLLTFPLDNYAGLIWYLNLPYATADGTAGQSDADGAFSEALYGRIPVYATGDRFYDGIRGKTTMEELLKPQGISEYTKGNYELFQYIYTDANFDGQQEMLIHLKAKNSDDTSNVYILLSYQSGGVFAYVMPYLSYNGALGVCSFDVYENWYLEDSRIFTGIVFDKDKMAFIYSDGKVNPSLEVGRTPWNDFETDFGY